MICVPISAYPRRSGDKKRQHSSRGEVRLRETVLRCLQVSEPNIDITIKVKRVVLTATVTIPRRSTQAKATFSPLPSFFSFPSSGTGSNKTVRESHVSKCGRWCRVTTPYTRGGPSNLLNISHEIPTAQLTYIGVVLNVSEQRCPTLDLIVRPISSPDRALITHTTYQFRERSDPHQRISINVAFKNPAVV